MYLLETLIDTKLSDDGHSDDEVGNFYDSFKDNYKAYKDENPDTVQILLEFLDFQKCLISRNWSRSLKANSEYRFLLHACTHQRQWAFAWYDKLWNIVGMTSYEPIVAKSGNNQSNHVRLYVLSEWMEKCRGTYHRNLYFQPIQ